MTRILTFTAMGVFALALSACVQEQTPERTSFDGLAGTRTVDTDGDVEMNGVSVTLRGRVGGDVEMNGASVDLRADVDGDAEANGASAELDGDFRGRTLVNAGSASLNGRYSGPVEVNAGAAELRGVFNDALVVRASRVNFRGDAAAPVRLIGEGARYGWREDSASSRVRVRGVLSAGGTICAHKVSFTSGARVGAPLAVIADSAPEFAPGFDPVHVTYQPREGACA